MSTLPFITERGKKMLKIYETMFETLKNKTIAVYINDKISISKPDYKNIVMLAGWQTDVNGTKFVCENHDKYQTNAKLTFVFQINPQAEETMEIIDNSINSFVIAINYKTGDEEEQKSIAVDINEFVIDFFDDRYAEPGWRVEI